MQALIKLFPLMLLCSVILCTNVYKAEPSSDVTSGPELNEPKSRIVRKVESLEEILKDRKNKTGVIEGQKGYV